MKSLLFFLLFPIGAFCQHVKLKDIAYLKKSPSDYTGQMLNIGDSVTLIALLDNDYWEVQYNSKNGYLLDATLLRDASYNKIKQGAVVLVYTDPKKLEQEKIAREKKQKEENARKSILIKKYGAVIGNRLFKGVVSLGMTKAMVKEVYGEPDDINRTVTKYSVNEQWVYGEAPQMELFYFENGKLTAWQD